MGNQDNKHYEQNSDGNINAKDFLIGALVGGIVGAATALFLAPRSGKEIRSNIGIQAQSLKEKTDHLREAAVLKGTEIIETAKDKTSSIGQTVSKQSNEIMGKVKGLKSHFEAEDETKTESTEDTSDSTVAGNDDDIQRKLEETKKAFDETESLLNS